MDFVMVVLSPGRSESCSKPNFLRPFLKYRYKDLPVTQWDSRLLARQWLAAIPETRNIGLIQLTGTLCSGTAVTRVSAGKFELNWYLEVNQNYSYNQPCQEGNTLFPFHECVFYRVCRTNLFLVGRTERVHTIASMYTSWNGFPRYGDLVRS